MVAIRLFFFVVVVVGLLESFWDFFILQGASLLQFLKFSGSILNTHCLEGVGVYSLQYVGHSSRHTRQSFMMQYIGMRLFGSEIILYRKNTRNISVDETSR